MPRNGGPRAPRSDGRSGLENARDVKSSSNASSLSDWRAFFSLGSHKQKKKKQSGLHAHQLPPEQQLLQQQQHQSNKSHAPKELAQRKAQQKNLKKFFGIDCGVKCMEGDTGHALEDRVLIQANERLAVLAVIDGHGGSLAADFVMLNVPAVVEKTIQLFEEEQQPDDQVTQEVVQAETISKPEHKKMKQQEALRAAVVDAIERMDGAFIRRATRVQDLSGACLLAVVLYKPKPLALSSAAADDEDLTATNTAAEEEKVEEQAHQCSKMKESVVVMTIHCGDCRVVSGRRKQQEEAPGSASHLATSSLEENVQRSSLEQKQQKLMVSDFEVRALTEDHCASNRSERQRVLSRGGIIQGNRIAGVLEPFRSIGDIDVKTAEMNQWVIATPEVAFHQLLDHPDNLLVLATDGIWGVLPNEEAIAIAHHAIMERSSSKPEERLQLAAQWLYEGAVQAGSVDDISVVVLQKTSEAGGMC